MVQKYQNEIAPIFYCGMSTKTNEKDPVCGKQFTRKSIKSSNNTEQEAGTITLQRMTSVHQNAAFTSE